MKKIYPVFFLFIVTVALTAFTEKDNLSVGSGNIIIRLDDSKYGNIDIEEVYVVFDKYDRTGAGIVKEKLPVVNNTVIITDVPLGKYFVDIYTSGVYRQHFSMVMKSGNKESKYKLKLDNVVYMPLHESSNTFASANISNESEPIISGR